MASFVSTLMVRTGVVCVAQISYGFSLMLGAVSYWTAQKFVKHIYLTIHID